MVYGKTSFCAEKISLPSLVGEKSKKGIKKNWGNSAADAQREIITKNHENVRSAFRVSLAFVSLFFRFDQDFFNLEANWLLGDERERERERERKKAGLTRGKNNFRVQKERREQFTRYVCT